MDVGDTPRTKQPISGPINHAPAKRNGANLLLLQVLQVTSDESMTMARDLAKKEGLLVGISAGAAVKVSRRGVFAFYLHHLPKASACEGGFFLQRLTR